MNYSCPKTSISYELRSIFFTYKPIFIFIGELCSFNQLEVELGSYIPKANVLRLESITVRYLAGKIHHANAFRLPMAFSNLI